MKENWALVYGRDMFCAYKTTTQQSQRLIDTHHEEESKTNFKALQSSISLSFPIKILKMQLHYILQLYLKWLKLRYVRVMIVSLGYKVVVLIQLQNIKLLFVKKCINILLPNTLYHFGALSHASSGEKLQLSD